ncbi:hypothetical protein HU200_054251 [Digitaria exilis]|uniref:Lysine-specific demethylase REF6 n=1 Tax=Digitaria exilis TaxID=1010633 RepID=A0A835AKU0_9POAL|nr:hypothetical protein HU200_054251 [Digitaria exilis]
MASAQGELVPPWLKSLPLAPEFHPTAAEFADPVAYLLRIEPVAAPFGVCKVVPPLPPPPKRTTLGNLSRSFAALHPEDLSPTFPTRHQQLGLCPRRPRPALKPVWHSSRRYTLPQFEAEAGAARKMLLARHGVPASRQHSTLDVEALFWRACADQPVVVEYASDMPGSGFAVPCGARPAHIAATNVGETAWNMRGVARSPASLLRFMPEDVPGVTSPMLYVAMMFSWFAWHVEDHELHSLNYLHSGAPKTWYGVPRDAALAFEDVVRVHGYGGEVNPLAFEEVLYVAGFNYAEASNIATPEWLRVAKEAAVRRASINRPPMVSHYQLLYELALSMCLRERAAKWLMSADSNLINKQFAGSGESHLIDALRSATTSNGISRYNFEINGDMPLNRNSSLDLLASAYGDPSDSDEDVLNKKNQVPVVCNELMSHTVESQPNTSRNGGCDGINMSSSKERQQGPSSQRSQCIGKTNNGPKGVRTRNKYQLKMMLSEGFQAKDIYSEIQKKVPCEPSSSNKTSMEPLCGTDSQANRNSATICMDGNRSTTTMVDNIAASIVKPDKDSSRMHVFCLEHAIEVEKQLQTIGGAHIFLLCRPEYPKIESEAKLLAEEMQVEYDWKDILFNEASVEDRKKIQEVVQDEDTIPTNSDWAVKLGINLYYSANLAKSPLYNKQLPYNRVIYKAFGCSSPNNSPVKLKTYTRRQARAKKIVLAGRWCGKVWMSNQVHPSLANRIKSHQPETIDQICPHQKSNAEHAENSSREATPTRKSSSRAIEEKPSKREKEPLEKAIAKKPKLTEENNSRALEGAAEASNGGTVVEKTSKIQKEHVEKPNTKKPKHIEEDKSNALKAASSSSPSRVVIRCSSRIANRKNMLKSKMEEEDNGPGSRPKAKIEESDGPASRSRARPLRQKTNVGVKKRTKKTRAEKQKASSQLEEFSATKQQPSSGKQKTNKVERKQQMKKTREGKGTPPSSPKHGEEYACDIEGCSMSFSTKQELSLHKRDICPVKGCGRKFFSHKYLLQHRKVHTDDRPLKCSWKGCDMAFKWPWARTEHMRVHTGDRPYVCPEPGCGTTFRFVSDFSRHKRRTGHAAKKGKTKK